MNKNKNEKGIFILNKHTIIFIFIYFLFSVGITYAYFAYQVENTVAITGNVIAIDADLEVELVSGINAYMVPMKNTALSNAINGIGSDNGACIDSSGNLSCQVYKITLTNNGSRLQHLNGTIELYAKEGTNNIYTNLKWRELTDATTLKEDAEINGMIESPLVTDLTIESKTEKIWYIAVWISETDYNQTNTDKGDFGGTVTFEVGGEETNVITETILEPNAETDEGIDFSLTSKESNTNGIYLRSGTENDTHPIYYYRGDVNNNLIFANFCWKIVRTTETGGLKIIYNGTPTDGQCNNTGTATQISTKAFNTSRNSPAYVGYMYSTPYEVADVDMSSVTDAYYYGNSVTYSNGTYTLTNTISSADWASFHGGGLSNNHYTCFSTGTTCESVYYIYNTDSSVAYYITLTGGKKIEDALTDMLGADDTNTANYNTTSSTIKGNNTTEGTLDYWYYNNIQLAGYNSYIEDTVWCNDRGINTIGGFNPNGGTTALDSEASLLTFSIYERLMNATPSLTCSRNIDRFTVSESNGNGDLDYPVGLLTLDEANLAGGSIMNSNDSFYLYTGRDYWAGSPVLFDGRSAFGSYVYFVGSLISRSVDDEVGVRPSVSLKPGFSLAGDGDGSVTTPYVVQ